ncbi:MULTISPECIES: hypothetical protein [unclassified Variovorax]|uniref:hypothetical protein n=1 Tax=unclassified Variovorax TaxID=663243 RepID=UPI003F47BC00
MVIHVVWVAKYAGPYRPGVAEIGVVDSFGGLSRCSECEAIQRIRSGIRYVVGVNGKLAEVVVAPATDYFGEHLCTVLDGTSCRLLWQLAELPRTLH